MLLWGLADGHCQKMEKVIVLTKNFDPKNFTFDSEIGLKSEFQVKI